MEPSENWDHLFRELGPPCVSLKWSYLLGKVIPTVEGALVLLSFGSGTFRQAPTLLHPFRGGVDFSLNSGFAKIVLTPTFPPTVSISRLRF